MVLASGETIAHSGRATTDYQRNPTICRQMGFLETFEWMYTKSAIADFPLWLRDPDASLYWITGKPGSGKSTLMKYIFDHHTTRKELNTSAVGKQLILISA